MIKAMGDTLIVERVKEEKKGNIIIPLKSQSYDQRHGLFKGVVVAIGPDYPYEVKVGDTIIYRPNEGKKIYVDDVEYLVLKEKWVDAVLGGDAV